MIHREGEHWISDWPMGRVKVRFAPPNNFGVMDHDVTVGSETTHNAFRVIPNGDGSEVIFSVFKGKMSDEPVCQGRRADPEGSSDVEITARTGLTSGPCGP
jgi:hypothetical protein